MWRFWRSRGKGNDLNGKGEKLVKRYSDEELQEVLRKHEMWLQGNEGGEKANLREADLRGADLDYSCWPLWCGSLDVKVDRRIAAQLCYHFCRLDCDDPAYLEARNAVLEFANTFHRVEECGRLEAAGGGKNEK